MKRILGIILIVILISFCGSLIKKGASHLIYSHSKHVEEMGLECEFCHNNASSSNNAEDILIPEMSKCGECHDIKSNCEKCHSEPSNVVKIGQIVENIVFSHKEHLKRGLECLSCHKGINKSKDVFTKHIPEMERCFECHDGKKVSKRCNLCHINLKESGLIPKNHDNFWRDSHGIIARVKESECYECHSEGKCARCHEGRIETDVHPRGFKFQHGIKASADPKSCNVCHSIEFCKKCHG